MVLLNLEMNEGSLGKRFISVVYKKDITNCFSLLLHAGTPVSIKVCDWNDQQDADEVNNKQTTIML